MKYLLLLSIFISTNLFSQDIYTATKSAVLLVHTKREVQKIAKSIPKTFHIQKQTTDLTLEVVAESPSEDFTTYWLKGLKGSHLRGTLVIVDTTGVYQIGQKYKLIKQ